METTIIIDTSLTQDMVIIRQAAEKLQFVKVSAGTMSPPPQAKQPLFAITLLQAVTRINLNIFVLVEGAGHSTSYILCSVSIFTTATISEDRLLALLLGLQYRHVATLWRVCEAFQLHLCTTFGTAAFLALVSHSYSSGLSLTRKIILKLRQHQVQVQDV